MCVKSSNTLNFNLSPGANHMHTRASFLEFPDIPWLGPFQGLIGSPNFDSLGGEGLQTEYKGHFYAQGLTSSSLETQMLNHYFCRDPGSPNHRTISFSNALATSAVISVLAGNASFHPETVFSGPGDPLKMPSTLAMMVKSICQSSPGYVPLV